VSNRLRELSDEVKKLEAKLREAGGLLGDIFTQATPRFNNPVNLKRVIAMIDEEDWSAMDVDVKGAAFEGLLEKAASEGKKGAGQYFTPRVLIQSIVRVMKPDPRGKPEFKISDPAICCGIRAVKQDRYPHVTSTPFIPTAYRPLSHRPDRDCGAGHHPASAWRRRGCHG